MNHQVAIIGAGPAGLMAAEVLSNAGCLVTVYDAMPSAGRKFLQAGRGGLNITHSLPFERFMEAYGVQQNWLKPMIQAFDANHIRAWVHSFGIETFVGSSGRVFPIDKKAAPLLRAWLHRLRVQGVRFAMKHRFTGWVNGQLQFDSPIGPQLVKADAVVLAMGGASWPHLGSTGAWMHVLAPLGVHLQPFKPANCGFLVDWSDHLQQQYAGLPIKPVSLSYTDMSGKVWQQQGELMLSKEGIEGGLIYQAAAGLRDAIQCYGPQTIHLDLLPNLSLELIEHKLAQRPSHHSLSNKLKGALKLTGVKLALIHEWLKRSNQVSIGVQELAWLIKHYPVTLLATGSVETAISTAGGVGLASLTPQLMLNQQPGVFCAGEMLDWEAPTGGYLLTAVLATGYRAGLGVIEWLALPR